jgi:hypothetical protein
MGNRKFPTAKSSPARPRTTSPRRPTTSGSWSGRSRKPLGAPRVARAPARLWAPRAPQAPHWTRRIQEMRPLRYWSNSILAGKVVRGRCYDHNFRRLLTIFCEKNWHFSQKPMLWSNFCII